MQYKYSIDDNVICILNDNGYERYLTIGKTYKVLYVYIGKITKLEHIYVNSDIKHQVIKPLSSQFLTINKFKKFQRKEKLIRLNLL